MTVYTKTMMEALAEVREIQAEASMKPAHIAQLKKAYEPMRDKKISVSNANKLQGIMDKFAKNKDVLIQLVKKLSIKVQMLQLLIYQKKQSKLLKENFLDMN